MDLHYLITGGLGFIGKNLTNALDSFVILDRDHPTSPFDVSLGIPNIHTDILIHLASFTDVRKSIKHPAECIEENISGLVNCLEFARHKKLKKVVFTSSIGSKNPISPYTASKSACNALCKAFSESYNMNVVVLNLSNVYGPHSAHKNSVIASFIKSILNDEPIFINGDGSQTRDFIYVDDVVKSILNETTSKDISTGIQTSVKQIVNFLNDLSQHYLGRKSVIVYRSVIKGEIHHLNTTQTIDNFTYLEHGLMKTFKWFIDNYNA